VALLNSHHSCERDAVRNFGLVLFLICLSGCASAGAFSSTTPPPIPVLPAPPPPWPIPAGIIGNTPEDIVARLGPPAEDHTSTNRLIDFMGRDCVLTVFFVREADDWRAFDVMQILPSGENVDPNPCYRSIIEASARQ
jgi:hypothetical protein